MLSTYVMEEYSHLRLDDEYASTLHEILERRITDAEAALSARPAQPVRFFYLVEGSGRDTKRAQHIEHSPFRLHMRLRGLAATSPWGLSIRVGGLFSLLRVSRVAVGVDIIC